MLLLFVSSERKKERSRCSSKDRLRGDIITKLYAEPCNAPANIALMVSDNFIVRLNLLMEENILDYKF